MNIINYSLSYSPIPKNNNILPRNLLYIAAIKMKGNITHVKENWNGINKIEPNPNKITLNNFLCFFSEEFVYN